MRPNLLSLLLASISALLLPHTSGLNVTLSYPRFPPNLFTVHQDAFINSTSGDVQLTLDTPRSSGSIGLVYYNEALKFTPNTSFVTTFGFKTRPRFADGIIRGFFGILLRGSADSGSALGIYFETQELNSTVKYIPSYGTSSVTYLPPVCETFTSNLFATGDPWEVRLEYRAAIGRFELNWYSFDSVTGAPTKRGRLPCDLNLANTLTSKAQFLQFGFLGLNDPGSYMSTSLSDWNNTYCSGPSETLSGDGTYCMCIEGYELSSKYQCEIPVVDESSIKYVIIGVVGGLAGIGAVALGIFGYRRHLDRSKHRPYQSNVNKSLPSVGAMMPPPSAGMMGGRMASQPSLPYTQPSVPTYAQPNPSTYTQPSVPTYSLPPPPSMYPPMTTAPTVPGTMPMPPAPSTMPGPVPLSTSMNRLNRAPSNPYVNGGISIGGVLPQHSRSNSQTLPSYAIPTATQPMPPPPMPPMPPTVNPYPPMPPTTNQYGRY